MLTKHEKTRDKSLAPILVKLTSGHCSAYRAIWEAYERGYSRGASFRKPEIINEKLQDLGNKLQILSMLLGRKKEDDSISVEKLQEISNLMNQYYHDLTDTLLAGSEDVTNAK